MATPRGREHTTLTETATIVVHELRRLPGIKMIAPGIIDARRSGKRFITVCYTRAGFELLISGQGVQKVAVHTRADILPQHIIQALKQRKSLQLFSWNERDRK